MPMFRILKRAEGTVTASFRHSGPRVLCREHDGASPPNFGHQVSDRYDARV